MTVTCHPPFALNPALAFPEMTPLAFLVASRSCGTVLMPLIVDDKFHVFARERSLPPCALSFLMLAGSWSAQESRSGFVPNSMLADFSSDFAQAEGTLCSAGILKRVKGGVRILEGRGLTVVNAKDVSRDIDRERAEAEERREAWRLKKQGQRAVKRAEKRERIAAGVPAVSPGESVDVPRENPGHLKKQQVNGSSVPGDSPGTSPGTAKTSASDDQNLFIGVKSKSGVNQNNARASEAPSPGTLALVVAECSKLLRRPVTEAEACRAIDVWDRRAEASGKVIHDPVKFYPACAEREHKLRKLEAILAAPESDALTQWRELGQAPEPPPGAHVFMPSGVAFDESCMHPGCVVPEKNKIHLKGAGAVWPARMQA